MTLKTATATITPSTTLLKAFPSLARLLATGAVPSKGNQVRAAMAYNIVTNEDAEYRAIMLEEWAKPTNTLKVA